MACETAGCNKPVDRDGLCFLCRMRSVGFTGLYRFQAAREGGYTQHQLGAEMFADAKADGKQIAQVRGRRGATERHTEEGWAKV